MNRIYKVIWSKARNCYVVVSEIAKTHSKGGTGVSGVVRKAVTAALLTAAVTAMLLTPVGLAWAEEVDISSNDDGSATAVYQNNNKSIKIGDSSISATGATSIAIGTGDTSASGEKGVAIGNGAHADTLRATAVGDGAAANNQDGSAYGSGATSTGKESTAIGHDAKASETSAAAIGNAAEASGADSFAAGYDATAAGGSSVAVGEQAKGLAGAATAVGSDSRVTGESGSAFGAASSVSGESGIAVGDHATDAAASGTAIGQYASVGIEVYADGKPVLDENGKTIPLTDESGKALGVNGIAVGTQASSLNNDATALGTEARAEGEKSNAIGYQSKATGDGSIAVGELSKASEDDSVAIGTGANASVAGGVALGSSSIADTPGLKYGYDPKTGKTATEADRGTDTIWYSTAGAISVGGEDPESGTIITRQITHVASGTMDDDAVNVAQLKAAMTHYYSVDTTKATDEAGNNNYDNDGAQSSGKNAIAAGVNAKATAANASAFGSNVTASGINATAIGTAGTTAGDFSTAIGNGSVSASSASTAVGYGNVSASGTSTAIGNGSVSASSASTAVGYGNVRASGTSQAFGNNNVSASINSTAIGYGGVSATGRRTGTSDQGSLAMGSNGVTASNGSIAIGISGVTASGLNSTAIGINSVTASGSNSTAIGGNGIATGSENSVVVGYSNSTIDSSSEGAYAFGKSVTITSSSGGLALGNSTSLSSASGSTAVGSQTSVSGSNGSAAMGTSSKVTGSSAGSTAVGNSVTVERSSSGSAAFGTSTTITSSNGSTLVGNNSRITGSYGVSVLGVNTTISGSNGAIAMGNDASISGSSGAILLAENYSSISNSSGSTAIGNSVSISKGSGSNVFGDSSSINSDGGSMVLGNSSHITSGSGSHLLGNESSVNGSSGSTVIGNSSSVTEGSNGSQVFGNQAKVYGGSSGAMAIGNSSQVYGGSSGSYAIGGNAKVYGGSNGATAVGPNSEVSNGSGGSQAFGNAAKVTNGSGGASAVGSGALVDGSGGSDAFGNNAKVIGGGGSTAVGNAAQVTGSGGATAVGTNAYVGGSDNGLAVGARSSVTGGWAGTAIGTDASTTVSQGVALGSNALAERGPEEEDGYDPIGEHPGQEGTPTWRATAAAVSVGGKTFAKQNENGEYVDADGNVVETAAEAEQITYTRQITNVAAGRLDTDAVNVAQLKQLAGQMAEEGSLSFGSDGYVPATETEPAKEQITKWHGQTLQIIGDTTYKTDETTSEPVVDKDGNIITSVDKAKDGTDAIKISLARDIDVDTVVVNGKDGAPGEPGTPGSIGMKGEDGEIKTVTITSEGKPGVDGKDGETITRLIVDDKPVATLDDGLKFGANAPEEEEGDNPVANKLNSTVKIVGVDAKEDHEYSADNLTTTVKQAEDGTTTITVMMDKDPEFDTLVVNGKDGAPGEPGTPGSIGMKGEDGEIKTVTITSEGKPGVDGKDGETITRLIVDDKPVATLDDGLRFAGDDGLNADGSETDKVIPKKLNNRLDIVGDTQYEITTTTTDTTTSTNAKKIKDGNILTSKGTAQDGSDAIKIELNKDVDLGPDGSLMVGGEVDEEGNPKTDEYGNPTSIKIGPQTVYNINGGPETGDYIIGLDNKTWDPTNIVSGRAATEDQLAAVQTHYYSVNDNGTQQDNWDNKGATGVNALAAGTNAKATGDRSVAVGDKARVTTDGGVAIGADSVATTGPSTGGYDVITGARNFVDTANAHAWTSSAAAVSVGNMDGNEPITRQITGVAAGTLDTDAVNVAQLRRVANAASIHDYSVNSVDPTHDQNYNNSGAVGSNALAAGVNARALGDNAVAVGNATNAQKKDAVAIGNGADAFYENSVALGANTQTAKEVGTASYEIAGTTYYFAGAKPVGTVSVGTEGVEGDKRTITNVAAGRISEESTDAINGSQLWAVTEAMKSGHTEVTVGEGTPAGEGEGVYNTGGNLDLNVTQAEDGHNIYDLKLAKDIDVDTIAVNGKDGKDGKIGINGKDGETSYITVSGKDGAPGVDGVTTTRILIDDKPVATLDDGMKYSGDFGNKKENPVPVKLNKIVDIRGNADNEDDLTDKNIGVVAKADGEDAKLTIKLNKDLNLVNEAGETGSITMGDVHIHDGDKISFGGNKIHNVDAGVEDTDVVNVSQLKQYSGAARTEVTVNGGTAAPDNQGTYTTDGGNLQLRLTKAQDGHDVFDVKLSDNIELGKPGKDGVDGKIGINGKDGNSVVIGHEAIDGKDGEPGKDGIAVNGKDGQNGVTIWAEGKDGADGHDGHIGIAGPAGKDGKDGVTDIYTKWGDGTPGTYGKDGKDGTDGITRIVYTDPEGDEHQVATMDDGLKFGADSGNPNPAVNKLSSTVNIVGEGKKEEGNYSGKNLKTFISQEGEGKDAVTTITVKMDRDLEDIDTIVVNGKDGKDGLTIKGADGAAGSIGIAGPAGKDGSPGEVTHITVTNDGTPGLDGKDGVTRIEYKDPEGNDHEVATLDDGMKYSGDFGNTNKNPVQVKLNNNVDIVGNSTAASADDLTDGNIGVVAAATEDGGAQLVVKLNKDVNLGSDGSLKVGGDTEGNKQIVIGNQEATHVDGTTETGDYITGLDNTNWDPDNIVSGRAATEDQLAKAMEEAESHHTAVTVNDYTGEAPDEDGTHTTKGNLLIAKKVDDAGKATYDIMLNDDINIGGAKDGKDGVDGHIGVNGADGKSGVGIDGKDGITITGKDGKDGVTIYGKDGEDGTEGHIGLTGPAGKDGKDAKADITVKEGPVGVDGTDGAGGKDGMDRIVYEDHNGTTHEVATMEDGLKFGANAPAEGYEDNPVPNKLNSTISIVGEGDKEESSYSGKNLKTFVSQENGDTTITVKMDKDLETDTVVINGKDGKDGLTIKGADGEPGSIGMAGKDGEITHITINNDGKPGVDGKDGITRIEYKDPEGNDHEVATLDDGMKYGGDTGDVIAKKLNEQVNVIGGITDESKLTAEDNLGVVSDGTDNLKVRLAKDVNLGSDGSVKMGDTKINNEGLTINEGPSVTKNGIDAGSKKITNVAPGEADTDAVNVSQLKDFQGDVNKNIGDVNNRINRLGDRVDKVGAGAAALAGLHPLDFDPDAKWDVAAGYGHYRGENAVAVGAFYRPSEDVMVNVASTVGNGDNMISAGVSVKVGGNTHVSNSRVALSKQVLEMRKEIEDLRSLMADSAFGKQLDLSKLQLFPDTPENHWAYDYVATLAGNGLLEGYPDGNFRGNRALTRYEVAAILYRAMLNGAQLTQRALEEFAPELDRIRVDTLTRHSDGTPSIQRVRIIKDRR